MTHSNHISGCSLITLNKVGMHGHLQQARPTDSKRISGPVVILLSTNKQFTDFFLFLCLFVWAVLFSKATTKRFVLLTLSSLDPHTASSFTASINIFGSSSGPPAWHVHPHPPTCTSLQPRLLQSKPSVWPHTLSANTRRPFNAL